MNQAFSSVLNSDMLLHAAAICSHEAGYMTSEETCEVYFFWRSGLICMIFANPRMVINPTENQYQLPPISLSCAYLSEV